MKWFAWLIPVLLAAGLYHPIRTAGLVWDDEIVQNKQIIAIDSIGKVFFPPPGIRQWSRMYYRPIITVTYLIDKALFGRNATLGPHAAVVLFHLITTFFVWMLARQVLYDFEHREWGALAAGVLFAAHPIHTESVCWITGRSDTVAAMFFVPSMVVALQYRNRPSWWAFLLAPALYFLAVLTKEVALSALLVMPWIVLLLPPETQPKRKRKPTPRPKSSRGKKKTGRSRKPKSSLLTRVLRLVPLLGMYGLATVAYFVLRDRAGIHYGGSLQADSSQLAERFFAAVAYYGQKVFVPPPQSCFVTELPAMQTAVFAAIIGLVLLGLSIRLYRHGTGTFLIAIGWFCFALGPSLAIAVRRISETPVAERYLYLPSVGVALVFGAILCLGLAHVRWQVPAIVATVLVTGSYGYATVRRIEVWQSDVTLWSDAAGKNPGASLPWHSLGRAYNRTGDLDSAVECLQKALNAKDADAEGNAYAHNSLGTCYYKLNKHHEAEREFRAAIKENPRYDTPHFNLAVLTMHREQIHRKRTGTIDVSLVNQARNHLSEALKRNRHYMKAWLRLGQCESLLGQNQLNAGHRDRAAQHLRNARDAYAKAIELDPVSSVAQTARQRIRALEKSLQDLAR